jgi:hypothetical protein
VEIAQAVGIELKRKRFGLMSLLEQNMEHGFDYVVKVNQQNVDKDLKEIFSLKSKY